MSRLLCRNKSIELLEPYEGKLSRTVLRGERGSNVPDLPDFIRERYRPATGEGDMSFLSRSYSWAPPSPTWAASPLWPPCPPMTGWTPS